MNDVSRREAKSGTMDNGLDWIIVIGGVLLFGVLAILWEKHRTRIFRKIAQHQYYRFSSSSKWSRAFRTLRLFTKGRSDEVKNIIQKTIDDMDISLCDYSYNTNKYRSSLGQHSLTVFHVSSPSFTLPSFTLCPRRGWHAIAEIVRPRAIYFNGHPTFSKRYILHGDAMALRRLFGPLLLTYYEHHPGLSTEGEGTQLVVYRYSRRVSTKHLETFLEDGLELLELFRLGTQSQQSVLKALHDEQVQVRRAAARAIGLFRDRRALPSVLPLLHDPHESVRRGAVWTVSFFQDVSVLPHILHALNDPSVNVYQEAILTSQKLCPLVQCIIFGHRPIKQGEDDLQTMWNPDVSKLTLPMPSLRYVGIDVHTYDFHQVERFLTYAINYLGQDYLRNEVDIHVHGDVEKLHPNIRNNLTNLCQRVHVHEKAELSIFMSS